MIEWPPAPGTIFAFPIGDGRFGACRVAKRVERNEPSSDWHGDCAVIVTTPYLSNKLPKIDDPLLLKTFLKNHHSWNDAPEYWLVSSAPKNDLSLQNIGVVKPPQADAQLAETHFGFWSSICDSTQLLKQEEWDNGDPDEILAKERDAKIREFEERKKQDAARASRLAGMSLIKFRRTKFFADWESYVRPKVIVTKSRRLVRTTIDSISALGDKPTQRILLSELQEMISGFNKLYDQYQCFETVERDAICETLADLCTVLKLKDDPAKLFERWEDM
jgi:hypothetical protein